LLVFQGTFVLIIDTKAVHSVHIYIPKLIDAPLYFCKKINTYFEIGWAQKL